MEGGDSVRRVLLRNGNAQQVSAALQLRNIQDLALDYGETPKDLTKVLEALQTGASQLSRFEASSNDSASLVLEPSALAASSSTLRELDLVGWRCNFADLHLLSQLTSISLLGEFVGLNNTSAAAIASLTNLRKIDLGCDDEVRGAALVLLSSLRHVTSFAISDVSSYEITSDGLLATVRNW